MAEEINNRIQQVRDRLLVVERERNELLRQLGRLIQYAGRLHRASEQKHEVRIFDYLDASSPVMLKMCRKRRKAYETMGYQIEEIPLQVQE